MTFQKTLKAWMEREKLSVDQAAQRLGMSHASVQRFRSGYLPNKKNIKKFLLIIEEGKTLETLPASVKNTAPVYPKTHRYVRVSYPVDTLSDVLEKARFHGEVSLEENGEIFLIKKLGA